ncbi:undecaprenyl phosphate translocase family protein, partial [Halorubrum sp. SD626R]|uniref:undecaprenyl phosphate translocase family protein n=1 Tax=Halorubrum sp. SD626R TaxID=1419722 RepID=UPI001F540656
MSDRRDWITLYLKGIAMGSADAVPGVSGGTIALIVGIYERLIAAVTAVDPDRIRRVLAGVRPANFPDARAAFREVDGAFLLVLGAGIATAVVVVL